MFSPWKLTEWCIFLIRFLVLAHSITFTCNQIGLLIYFIQCEILALIKKARKLADWRVWHERRPRLTQASNKRWAQTDSLSLLERVTYARLTHIQANFKQDCEKFNINLVSSILFVLIFLPSVKFVVASIQTFHMYNLSVWRETKKSQLWEIKFGPFSPCVSKIDLCQFITIPVIHWAFIFQRVHCKINLQGSAKSCVISFPLRHQFLRVIYCFFFLFFLLLLYDLVNC